MRAQTIGRPNLAGMAASSSRTFHRHSLSYLSRGKTRPPENNSVARHLEDVAPLKSVEESFEGEFLDALREELGVGIDEIRLFLDFLEDLGTNEDQLVLTLPRSGLLSPKVGDDSLPYEKAVALVDALILPQRTDWHVVPEGYEDKDRQPWRYRRRLSVLRKPLIQIDDAPDPKLMIAPARPGTATRPPAR